MLEWTIKNGDDKLKEEITRTRNGFDSWFETLWSNRCTRERMLSEDSPLQHVYYKMTKPFEEVKEMYPNEAKQECSDCGEYVSKWIETEFSFCDEYGCGMSLCEDCVDKMIKVANLWHCY